MPRGLNIQDTILFMVCVCVCVCFTHFIHLSGVFDFYDDTTNTLYILSLSLAHKKSTVVFIMPYHVESLERLGKMLNKKQLDMWMGELQKTAVAVSLPKVTMEVSHNLQVKERCQMTVQYLCCHFHVKPRFLCVLIETPRGAGSDRGCGQSQS